MSAAPIKVLVIDDEPPIRKLLRMGLTTQGYQVLEAPNGKAALALLSEKPDLIMLDLGLPDIAGHDLLRMIRGRNESVPIVVLSSRGDEAGKGGHPVFLRELAAVMPRFANVRRMGAAALDIAYVAAGRMDAYWERGLNTWDFAAGAVMIREAGGTFGTLDGKQPTMANDVICGNEIGEQALRAALKGA